MECAKCGRELKDEKSRQRGYGPVCWKKIQKAKEEQQHESTEDEIWFEKGRG